MGFRRADCVARDQHPFEHAVRIAFQHAAIHECAGIALVRIADDVFLRAHRFGYRAPLQARGISSAAAPAQTTLGNLVDHFALRHLRQRFDQGGVSIGGDVVFNALRIDHPGIFQHDLLLPLEEGHIGGTNQPRYGLTREAVQYGGRVRCFDLLIKNSIAGRDQRAFGAEPHTADALHLATIFGAAASDFLVQRVLD